MAALPGVYTALKKDGSIYYRSSITHKNKHISLGSYSSETLAHKAYEIADEILRQNLHNINDLETHNILSFDKWITLLNLRDHKIYFKNPIYLKKRYFIYYLNKDVHLKFDIDDLFYYSNHKIMQRGGYLFVSDYGMQVNILTRYGIRSYSVPGRDYRFVNGDDTDYRYGNIEIINPYYGVTKIYDKGKPFYITKIHINGDFIVGRYSTETEAAIAYNKAVNLMKKKGINKNYPENYIEGIDEIEYAKLYNNVRISKKLREYNS